MQRREPIKYPDRRHQKKRKNRLRIKIRRYDFQTSRIMTDSRFIQNFEHGLHGIGPWIYAMNVSRCSCKKLVNFLLSQYIKINLKNKLENASFLSFSQKEIKQMFQFKQNRKKNKRKLKNKKLKKLF